RASTTPADRASTTPAQPVDLRLEHRQRRQPRPATFLGSILLVLLPGNLVVIGVVTVLCSLLPIVGIVVRLTQLA
uniref:hypothetical protein n=1 Tax=Cryobacterium sp. N21 TaxID=2048289 RepID=UPI001304AF4C